MMDKKTRVILATPEGQSLMTEVLSGKKPEAMGGESQQALRDLRAARVEPTPQSKK
jgi:hypothetical protein